MKSEVDATNKMSYAEFINAVAINTGIPEKIVRQIYDSGIDVIGKETYVNGRSVEIRNFGVYKTKKAQGRNVQLNNVSKFNGYTKFQFKPSSHFTKINRANIGEIDKKTK